MPATPDQVWQALTAAETLPSWLGKLDSGTFEVDQVITIEHAPNYFCTSKVRRCETQKLLAMSWQFPDEEPSELQIELIGRESTTELRLVHRGLTGETASYLIGWHTHLLYLEYLIAGTPRPMDDFWSLYDQLASASEYGETNAK
ncbi:SRPBCC domain-containing protein [Glutamicibacter arilaitensis]|uniref:SRPBCC domain-containing protein n=1 Tax=Glutamicibacter arilaitensis TaxID=256701 RepID=UPI00384F1AA7